MKLEETNDSKLVEEVTEAIRRHAEVNCNDLKVCADHGHVHIQGQVASHHQKRLVMQVALNISGVKDVHGPIRIKRVENLHGIYGF